MAQNLLSRLDFGNETADDAEIEDLLSYFVEQSAFHSFINRKERIRVVTAKKGVGKSALIKWAGHHVRETNSEAEVITCRGADLSGIGANSENVLETPNDYIKNWMAKICTLINRKIAARLNFAFRDDSITLIETAELEGFKERNIFGALLDRLSCLLPSDGPEKQRIQDEIAILKRIKRPQVWFMIDDLDATFQNTQKENLEISTFFSACRYLSQDMKDIVFRATMRADVWAIVRRFDESLDKMEQYVQEIQWPLQEFERLLYRRIKSQCEEIGYKITIPDDKPAVRHQKYFDEVFSPTMPWGEKKQKTYKVIHTLSYERPRWAIQLCKLAQSSALQDNQKIIDKFNIDEVWGEYGAKRIKDLVAEHKHQCPEIEELLNSFRGVERLLTRDQLLDWINRRVANHLSPIIEGSRVSSPKAIGHFLYRIGFILARADNEDGSYEHYHYNEMPDFLSGRTDEDFGVKWEIHPCYREALDIRKINKSHERGFRKRRSF